MTTNHTTKTITATTSELVLVSNYLEHCVPKSDRKNWKLNIVDKNPVEVRNNKK